MKNYMILFILCLMTGAAWPAAGLAESSGNSNRGAARISSAVPPVDVVSGDSADYVLDRPFPQWMKMYVAPQDRIQTPYRCVHGPDIIPGWARPLPVEPIRCAAFNEREREIWAATDFGVVFIDMDGRDVLYFAGRRWLPDDNVTEVAVTPGDDALVSTPSGRGIIGRRNMTLEAKAEHFELVTQARHNRQGMVTGSPLDTPGDVASFHLDDDDNDGQWTEMYLAAESFRYAATGDAAARENARRSFAAMKRLLTVSPVKGYPARSLLPAAKCPGKDPGRWRMLESGDYCWKSDTSVDELVGHYFGLPVYYDLVADETEKKQIKELIGDMTGYIAGNGFRLLDENGEVTTHGNWDPEWVNTIGKLGDQGLNSLQALSALRSAHHVTGDPEYLRHYKILIKEHHYHRNVRDWKEISDRHQVNHDSDEMAFLSFYNLMRYETSEGLRRKYYLEGLRRAWENDLPERNPEQIVIYGAFAKKDFRLDLAVRTLREIPLDLVRWTVRNSHRNDVRPDPADDRFGKLQNTFMFPYTEVRTMMWSRNMYLLDVEEGGQSEADATFWLLPYWMARYHGMIRPAGP